jgi:hypothetical protein
MPSKTRKVSKRVLEMWKDPATVWGKNLPLEKFWGDLASQKKVVLIHKDGTSKQVSLPNRKTQKYQTMMLELEEDTNVVAILSSNLSQDAYEVYLYPKAKDKSPEYVVKNYRKFFKPIQAGSKLRVPA